MTNKGDTSKPGEQGAQVVSFAPWDRALRRAQTRDRAFDLTTEPHKIAQSSELEVYYAIKRRGLEDVLPVLGGLRSEQIRTLFDLELWKTDRVAVSDALLWLEGFRESGREGLVRAAKSLDPEALAAVLRRRLYIALIPKEDRSDDEPLPDWVQHPPHGVEPIVRTPDERFFIAARTEDQWFALEGEGDPVVEEEERKQVLALVAELYLSEDWEFIASILRLAQADMLSDLEEAAYNFRNHRVEDLGFPPMDRALRVYSPMDPAELQEANYQPVSLNSREACLPILHHQVISSGLLGDALHRLGPGVAERVEADLLFVANSVLISDRVDPADMPSVEDALGRMKGYLTIALQIHGGNEDPVELAWQRLESTHVSVLHRMGYTCTLRLKSKAMAIYQHPGTGGLGSAAFAPEDQQLLEGLLATRPRYYDTEGAEYRAFSALADIESVQARLDEMTALASVSDTYGWFSASWEDVLPPDPAERDLDLQLLTSAVRYMLTETVEVSPLREGELLTLVDELGASPVQGQFADVPTVAQAVAEKLEGSSTVWLRPRIERLMTNFASVLFPLVGSEHIDLRFIEGVLRQSRDDGKDADTAT